MNTIIATLLAAAWQATAVTELAPPSPGVCALRYEDASLGYVVVLEKRDSGHGIVTALAVTGTDLRSARLVTAHVDSAKVLKPATARAGEALRFEAMLDDVDAGAFLTQDLANLGGRLELKLGKKGTVRYELPHPLPRREVVSKFLFCTHDLAAPKPDAAEE